MELSAGLGQLPLGLIPNEFATQLLAGEIKVSRAEELLGRETNAAEIEAARKGN